MFYAVYSIFLLTIPRDPHRAMGWFPKPTHMGSAPAAMQLICTK